MTGFKSILVPVSDAQASVAPLAAAFTVAEQFKAHVVALHVRTDPATAVPLVGEGMSGAMVEEMMTAAERHAATRAASARKAFDEALAGRRLPLASAPPTDTASAEWIDITGREEEAVAWRGRLSDLVVVGRPDGDESAALMTLNAALMESGKPILLAPAAPATVGRKIVVAWNGSAEAGRAVSAAMPLLKAAESVTILTIAEDDRTANVPAGELAAYLAWHGVDAACKLVASPHAHAGEALCRAIADLGADLLVMGAYTHSRLRQMILGGVTRHVLGHCPVSCLLCH